jgi:hypothetical protein
MDLRKLIYRRTKQQTGVALILTTIFIIDSLCHYNYRQAVRD